MSGELPSLTEGFDRPSLEAWRALATRSLKDQPLQGLVSRTADGLEIAPLYTGPVGDGRLLARAGQAFDGGGAVEGGWDVRAVVRHPDPAVANAQVLDELAGGAGSTLVRLDATGERGVAAGSAADLAQILDGVIFEAAPVALDAGYLGPQAARWLDQAIKRSPAAAPAFHLDPLSAFAETGVSPGPIESHLAAAAETGAGLAPAYPAASLFIATGRAAHEAGGSEAQELGMMTAAAVAYVRALDAAGLSARDALSRIALGVSVDSDVFVSIARLRAARLIWSRLADAFGAPHVAARIEARSSHRMLAGIDAWTNLLRLTGAGFAAAVGGADAIVLAPFTDAIGHPTPFARRQARNTQLVLMEESHLGRVADPAAGSWFVESLTSDLARTGWSVFQAIEGQGGLARALAGGFIAANVKGSRDALMASAAANHPPILGVTLFPDKHGAPVPVEIPAKQAPAVVDVRLPGPDSSCPPLTPMRVSAPFEEAGR